MDANGRDYIAPNVVDKRGATTERNAASISRSNELGDADIIGGIEHRSTRVRVESALRIRRFIEKEKGCGIGKTVLGESFRKEMCRLGGLRPKAQLLQNNGSAYSGGITFDATTAT